MKFLIYGAGAIGLAYAWLLSSSHDVTVLVKPEKLAAAQNGYKFTVHDLRKNLKQDFKFEYRPQVVTEITKLAVIIMLFLLQSTVISSKMFCLPCKIVKQISSLCRIIGIYKVKYRSI